MEPGVEVSGLDGKVAVVTGARDVDGIGRCYCQALAAVSATVIALDIDGQGARALAAELAATGATSLGLAADVAEAGSVAQAVSTVCAEFGGVDILVNNAGLLGSIDEPPLCEHPLDDWDRIFAVNLTGPLVCSRAVVPTMRARGGGKIVNQSSASVFPPSRPYGVSKLALNGLTVALARQLGRDNISVNAIAPGLVDTAAGFRLAPEGSAARQRRRESAALSRSFGRADDLVGALLLLCGLGGDWMTGQTVVVDGGLAMRA